MTEECGMRNVRNAGGRNEAAGAILFLNSSRFSLDCWRREHSIVLHFRFYGLIDFFFNSFIRNSSFASCFCSKILEFWVRICVHSIALRTLYILSFESKSIGWSVRRQIPKNWRWNTNAISWRLQFSAICGRPLDRIDLDSKDFR